MNPEQKFYQWIRNLLGPSIHCSRIENSIQSGMPDVCICWDGVETWVELKVFVCGRILLRKEQWGWCWKHCNAGGKVAVIALNEETDEIHILQFPHIDGVPHGKYLSVYGAAEVIFSKKAPDPLLNFLLRKATQ